MIKFEHTEVLGWEHAIRGMRNPMNSWERSDSHFHFGEVLCKDCAHNDKNPCGQNCLDVGPNDQDLMMRLAKGGPVHAKYRRMIAVYVTITAPLYWWQEFDTYRVGVAPNPTDIEMNSCSTMHKIHAKEFTLADFSHEHLEEASERQLYSVILLMNYWRTVYLNGGMVDGLTEDGRPIVWDKKDKRAWWQMIQLLPTSYNQKRTVMLNYEVLANIYKSRKDHRLDEWREFCKWIEGLPYSEIVTGKECEV